MTTGLTSTTASPSSSYSSPAPTSPQSSSPLFKLPRELRDRIYAYALTSSSFILWPPPTVYSLPASLSTPSPLPRRNIAIGLITTSRAVYHEATPLLYACNHFTFAHPSDLNMFTNLSDARFAKANIAHVYLRIRDRDLRNLWSGYLQSTQTARSLVHDLPHLRYLQVWFRSGHWAAETAEGFTRWHSDPGLENLCLILSGNKLESSEVRVVCVHRVAKRDVDELMYSYGDKLIKTTNGDVRTAWEAKHQVKVCLELTPVDLGTMLVA